MRREYSKRAGDYGRSRPLTSVMYEKYYTGFEVARSSHGM